MATESKVQKVARAGEKKAQPVSLCPVCGGKTVWARLTAMKGSPKMVEWCEGCGCGFRRDA